MPDLIPASDDDVAASLTAFLVDRRQPPYMREIIVHLAAETIVRRIAEAGLIVMRQPAVISHSTGN